MGSGVVLVDVDPGVGDSDLDYIRYFVQKLTTPISKHAVCLPGLGDIAHDSTARVPT